MSKKVPEDIKNNLFVKSSNVSDFAGAEVSGYDFNKGIDYEQLLKSYSTTGFQATNFAMAVDEINKMLNKKEEVTEQKGALNLDPSGRAPSGCTIFLGYTSNVVSSGMRDIVRFLAEHNLVDCIVTTAGGIEEDLIKCFAPTLIGSFSLQGAQLRNSGVNRIGNLVVPNDNYCIFEEWMMPLLDRLVIEQEEENFRWTPSKFIRRLGKEINNPSSILYWCYKNNISVYSPALTDGSIGDMLYVHSFRGTILRLDIVEDVVAINKQSVHSQNTGMIILGGGLIKHHICNANLMRNGADYCVYVNTAAEYDGSDAGASPDEAVSWGKIKTTAKPVKVFGETSLIFPLLVAQTFAKKVHK